MHEKVSLLISIISLILTIIFYLKQMKVKVPVYISYSRILVMNKPELLEGLNIVYKGTNLDNLIITRIAFWNVGNSLIEREHLSEKDPLALYFSGDTKIVGAKIVYQSKKSNNFELGSADMIGENPNLFKINIYFDYIEQDEGVVILLAHEAATNRHVWIQGSIKGAKSVQRAPRKFLRLVGKIISYEEPIVYFLLAILLFIFSFALISISSIVLTIFSNSILAIAVLLAGIVFGVFQYDRQLYYFDVPKSFRKAMDLEIE